jgi:hypothetical protein
MIIILETTTGGRHIVSILKTLFIRKIFIYLFSPTLNSTVRYSFFPSTLLYCNSSSELITIMLLSWKLREIWSQRINKQRNSHRNLQHDHVISRIIKKNLNIPKRFQLNLRRRDYLKKIKFKLSISCYFQMLCGMVNEIWKSYKVSQW